MEYKVLGVKINVINAAVAIAFGFLIALFTVCSCVDHDSETAKKLKGVKEGFIDRTKQSLKISGNTDGTDYEVDLTKGACPPAASRVAGKLYTQGDNHEGNPLCAVFSASKMQSGSSAVTPADKADADAAKPKAAAPMKKVTKAMKAPAAAPAKVDQAASKAAKTVKEAFTSMKAVAAAPAAIHGALASASTNSWMNKAIQYAGDMGYKDNLKRFAANKGTPVPLENTMYYFQDNKFKPECCPATYSSSTGCACLSEDQVEYLNERGGNRTLTSYF